MSTIKYKDYQALVEYDDGAFFVKVLHIDDLLVAQFDVASEAENVLRDLVDNYLAHCEASGRQPSRPFKGSFNVRISPDLHRRAAMAAADDGLSLNHWTNLAISEKLECTRLSDRIHGVITAKQVASVWGKGQLSDDEFGILRRPTTFTGHTVAAVIKSDKMRIVHG
ncbi:type II toxin-antitoxin system HicB family antitoxin [Rhizobium leguminosarum]|uniref:type II toxin-antitoxin system HicB family antitoxin n=1 Tax=Rhizobium leguminosarum TaxID=384 RepID=UPI001C905D35|nr:type II toxin-antitoxin system HicB family antitoxin [Rhizobium leguminosarum]MBY3047469.1 type II toxin-antitoxin system HicB family antitoxin [Rhizobium leguminosarum]